MTIGENDYYRAGLERLFEAGILLRSEAFAGAVYLSGRAVEAMLRAIIWRNDFGYHSGKKSLETGHNLREMLELVQNLGVLGNEEHRNELATAIQYVARLWFNNMRFLPTAKLTKYWESLGEVNRRRNIKRAARDYYDACSAVVKRCEVLCRN